MNDFTASNGAKFFRDHSGELQMVTDRGPNFIVSNAELALREFFQAEADERLGRWRWPENPDYVVYPCSVKTRVRVLCESGMGDLEWVDQGDGRAYEFVHAARAYFEAHPEPKPWQEAQAGELWELTVEGVTRTYAAIASTGQNDVYVRFFPTHEVNAVTVGPKAPVISAGRRIWPEVQS